MKRANGLIVVENAKDWYNGVDRNPWLLSRCDTILHKSLKAVDQSFEYYDVTQSFDLAIHYWELANKVTGGAEVLYCEFIGARLPMYSVDLHGKISEKCEFLGWDYSWINGDFYSCIYNDLSLKKELFTSYLHILNKYGLFQTENEVDDFIRRRKKLKRLHPKEMFEVGRFYKVKVFRTIIL